VTSPWRLAVFVLASAVGIIGLRLMHSVLAPWIPVAARPAAFMVVMSGGLLIGHAWTFRLVDPRGWGHVRLGPDAFRASAMALGAGLGALAIAVPSLLLVAIGWLRIEPSGPGSSLGAAAASLAVLVPASLWEEMFARGYAFATLRERWGAPGAIVATSALFGGMHFLNAGATPVAVAVVALGGVFLGLVLVKTDSLYAAWAAHLAWNSVLVMVMHATVSGLSLDVPDYRVVDAGPDWATGGSWGPEGGVFAALGLVVAAWILARRPSGRRETSGD
jgi:membrane protease YdiL (CAAX protease family)